MKLSPATVRTGTARGWFAKRTTDQDGIVAKLRASSYLSGSRDGMVKVKHRRTADCVVGGFRFGKDKRSLGSLLLGLYDQQGKLNHVGFTSSLKGHDRKLLEQLVRPLRGGGGFSGKAPGGPSRWNSGRAVEWEPLTPRLVLEVEYDSFTGDRFRHGTHFLRTRPDKAARACTYSQLKERLSS